jgi:glycosyltransferase involved in cell wall biosynthesis
MDCTYKISIAMATFNGANYLKEQLESIDSQIRKPDEIIICDDLSDDNTTKIIEGFKKKTLINTVLVINEERIGTTRNFEKAISLCSFDLIFLSDQDDIWDNNKIYLIERLAKNNPNKHVFINDAVYTDMYSNKHKNTVFGRVIKNNNLESSHIHGAATAITKKFRDIILPFPLYSIPSHDAYIHRWANIFDLKIFYPYTLQTWRIHGNNASSSSEMNHPEGLSKLEIYKKYKSKNNSEAYLKKMFELIEMLKIILDRKNKLLEITTEQKFILSLNILILAINGNHNRSKLFDLHFSKRIYLIIKMFRLGHYNLFNGYKSIIKDIFM